MLVRPPLTTPFNSASGHSLPMAPFISYWKPSWEEFLSRWLSLLLTFLFRITPHRLFGSPLLVGSPMLPAECSHSFSTLSSHPSFSLQVLYSQTQVPRTDATLWRVPSHPFLVGLIQPTHSWEMRGRGRQETYNTLQRRSPFLASPTSATYWRLESGDGLCCRAGYVVSAGPV